MEPDSSPVELILKGDEGLSERLTIRLSPQQRQRLETASQTLGISLSAVVGLAVSQLLEHPEVMGHHSLRVTGAGTDYQEYRSFESVRENYKASVDRPMQTAQLKITGLPVTCR